MRQEIDLRTSWFMLGVFVVSVMLSPGWAQEAVPGTVQLEDFEQRIGPLEVMGQRFTVVQIEMAVRAS